jgi:chromosome segregation ATPase
MASTLITEMKNIGIECDIAPNQIRSGYGVPICTILLLLVDKALQKKNFAFKKPNFEEKKTQSSNNAPEIEDEAPDLINNEIDYGDNLDEGEKKEETGKKEKREDDGNGILYSGTSQEEWQRELEKVSSKLKLDYNNLKSVGSNEWRNHIQTIKDNEEKFNKQIPESRAVLENLSSEIDKSLEKITKKEEVLSKNHQNIISSYKDKHKAGNNQFDEYKELNENVEAMKMELNDINDKIVKANDKYDLLSQKISDTSALGNTKQAIQNLQNENITMDMKINILNHSLLKYTLESDLGKIQLQTEGNNDASMFEDVL